ncbi:MAG: hypothetical protein ABFQ62_02105 [Patescibacteria group bacterium]
MNIYPSILTDSLQVLQKQLDLVKNNSNIEVVQVDIVDGQFADNLTITPLDLLDADFAGLKIDLHLMVEEPMDYVYEVVSVKKQLPIRAILSQVEKMSYFEDYIEEVKKHDWKVGLSLDLHTPLEEVKEVLSTLDILQIMTIEAGFQEQDFQEQALEKISVEGRPDSDWKNQNIELIVDGGVKLKHLGQLKKLGIDGVSVGSALWQAEDIQKIIQEFSKAS